MGATVIPESIRPRFVKCAATICNAKLRNVDFVNREIRGGRLEMSAILKPKALLNYFFTRLARQGASHKISFLPTTPYTLSSYAVFTSGSLHDYHSIPALQQHSDKAIKNKSRNTLNCLNRYISAGASL